MRANGEIPLATTGGTGTLTFRLTGFAQGVGAIDTSNTTGVFME